MAIYIDGFSCEVVPQQNPGEKTGNCDEGFRFIYMTNSGAWSHLLEPGNLETLIGEAMGKIPVGYNQLWVFEKKFCARPALEGARHSHRFDEKRREYPAELERHFWPGQLYVVLRDPAYARGSAALTYHTKLDEAVAYAQAQANELKAPTIAGLMLADEYWH